MAVRVTGCPGQIPPVALAVFATVRLGTLAFTEMVSMLLLLHPAELVAVTEYIVAVPGLTTMDGVVAPVLHE